MIVVDTSFIVALMHEPDAGHRAAVDFYAKLEGSFTTPPLILAEIELLPADATRK